MSLRLGGSDVNVAPGHGMALVQMNSTAPVVTCTRTVHNKSNFKKSSWSREVLSRTHLS